MKFIYTDGKNLDFIDLCNQLDASLNALAGGEENRKEYIEHNKLDNIHDVCLAYEDDVPIACVSFKEIEVGTAEVKRVFVKDDYRGKGISKKLMIQLEDIAKEKSYKRLVLETGKKMNIAVNLYQGLGYKIIPNYGQYMGMDKSVCLGKVL